MEELSGSAEKAKETLSSMDSAIKSNTSGDFQAQSSAVRGWIANRDFINSNKIDFEEFSKAIAEKGGSQNYLTTIFGGEKQLANMADTLGYESAEAFITAFNADLEGMESAWDTIELPADLLGIDELSFTAAKALHDVFYDINIGPLGERAGKQFTEGLNKML
jgi:hypothetical protein